MDEEAQAAGSVVPLVGANPPANQPQVISCLLNRSPTLSWPGPLPVFFTELEVLPVGAQSSKAGRGSPMTAPVAPAPASMPPVPPPLILVPSLVFPAIRFSAPTVEGPNAVL